ncbi:MAG: hypothetical protein HY719_12810 [Planctomycetes bacterium]|nr:hypothetical protein [Planctomycetota bacterium]
MPRAATATFAGVDAPCRAVEIGLESLLLAFPAPGPAPAAGARLSLRLRLRITKGDLDLAGVARAVSPSVGGGALVEVALEPLSRAARKRLRWERDPSSGGSLARRALVLLARGLDDVPLGGLAGGMPSGCFGALAVVLLGAILGAILWVANVLEDPPIDQVPAPIRNLAVETLVKDPSLRRAWAGLPEEERQGLLHDAREYLRRSREADEPGRRD